LALRIGIANERRSSEIPFIFLVCSVCSVFTQRNTLYNQSVVEASMKLLEELFLGERRVVIVADNARSHADPSTSRIITEQSHPQSPCRWQSSPLVSPRLKNSPDAVNKDGIPTLQSLSSLMMMPPVRQPHQYDQYDGHNGQPSAWPVNEANCTSDLLSEFLRISTDDLTLYHTDDDEDDKQDEKYDDDSTFGTTYTTSLTLSTLSVPTLGTTTTCKPIATSSSAVASSSTMRSTSNYSLTLPSLATWPTKTADTSSSIANVKKPVRRRSLDLNTTTTTATTADCVGIGGGSHNGVHHHHFMSHAPLPTSSAHV
jgi:hypothetical protein